MLDLLPYRRLDVGRSLTWDTGKRNPYIGMLFGYRGLTSENFLKLLSDKLRSISDNSLLPDFAVNFERQYAVFRAIKEGSSFSPVGPRRQFTHYIAVETHGDALPLFFFTLNTMLNEVILKAPNMGQYWQTVFKSVVEKAGGAKSTQ